jgi:hypothetical protein
MSRWTCLVVILLILFGTGGCRPARTTPSPVTPTATGASHPVPTTTAARPSPPPTTRSSPTAALHQGPTATRTAPPVSTRLLTVAVVSTPGRSPTPTASPRPPDTPTPTPTVPPPPLDTPTPTPAPVAVWEGTVILTAYGWEQALVPTTPDDPIYPHPRLNFDAVAGPAPRTFRAIFLQNDLVQLVLLPDLGGRILRWTDRTTGRQILYANPVLKPTGWGYRGWWLATGGMEWAFPTEEHGLVEYRSWDYRLLSNGVHLSTTDEHTGLRVEVAVQLEPGSSRVLISPRVTNPTDQAQPFQFWTNAMLTLSDYNAPSPNLTFVMPATEAIVHSTGDPALPGPGGVLSWPLYAGRDFSRYTEWRSYLGLFAPQAAEAGFAGAYDLGSDQGIVRVAPTWVRGVKLFCLGDLDAGLWTDDGSRYFELWGGLTTTFWEYATLEPGYSAGWSEQWYALSGMGGFTFANGEGAVRLTQVGGGVEVAVETVRQRPVTVVLRQGGSEVTHWAAEVGPGQPFRASWGPGGGPWGLQVLDGTGAVLIQYGL